MSIDFTQIAILIVICFGLFGWVHGARRVAVTTGGIFFAMVVVSLMGADLIQSLGHMGVRFRPKEQADLLLALLFAFTVYIVTLGARRLLPAGRPAPLTRRQRLSGMGLSLLNGFLLVANVVRYADPFLRRAIDTATGGWTWRIPLPHLSHPNGSTFVFSVDSSPITITPSPLLNIYDNLPTALILLFAFLTFVFIGTLYGRVTRSRG